MVVRPVCAAMVFGSPICMEKGNSLFRAGKHREAELEYEHALATFRYLRNDLDGWRKKGRYGSQTKGILELLTSVHAICDFVPKTDASVSSGEGDPESNTTIKKAYMRAVRHIHPDKLPSSLSLEQRVLAEAVFVVITEEYNSWRASM